MKKALTLLIAIFLASNMYAQPVTLDPTFGENGRTVIPGGSWPTAFDFDRSGNIVAAGLSGNAVAITKTNADGIIDENFGINGQILIPEDDIWCFLVDLKITTANKILLLKIPNIEYYSPLVYEVILRRFNEDGSVDQTFGDNGKMDISSLTGVHYPICIHSVNLEKDNFMLIAVTEHIIGDFFPASKSYILKYNYDGEPDESFGENGKAYLSDNESFNIHPRAIKILYDQSIVVAGYDHSELSPRGSRLAFCKLSPTGSFVTNFAHNGAWIGDGDSSWNIYFYSIIENTNGNLVLAGRRYFPLSWSVYFPLCSFYPDGTINSDFGSNGCYNTFNVLGYGAQSEKQILQNGSKYLVRDSYYILKINNNGTLDTNFNNTGVFPFMNFTYIDMRLQESDKLVVFGSFSGNMAIARLNIPYEVSIKETP